MKPAIVTTPAAEEWRPVKGYEGLYEVSNFGRIKHLPVKWRPKEFIMRYNITYDGYVRIGLTKDGKYKSFAVSRLVGQHFIPNPDNLPQINHKDEDKTNNHVDNLEWCSNKYNVNYGNRNMLASKGISKAVAQYSLDGELIRTWDSVTKAAMSLGFDLSSIAKCCNGRTHTSYHFVWKYINQPLK